MAMGVVNLIILNLIPHTEKWDKIYDFYSYFGLGMGYTIIGVSIYVFLQSIGVK